MSTTTALAFAVSEQVTVCTNVGSTTGTPGGSWISKTGAQPTTTAQGVFAQPGGNGGNSGGAISPGAAGTSVTTACVGDVKLPGYPGTAGTLTEGGTGGPSENAEGISGGGGGTGATATASGSAPTAPGGGAGGAHLQPRVISASGLTILEFSTGGGTITHVATLSRRITASRSFSAVITHVATFARQVTLRRAFDAAITHAASVSKQVGLARSATITHAAQQTRKAVALTRVASTTHTPTVSKAIALAAKVATVTPVALFARSVTLRRSFSASTTHVAKVLLFLEARLIPSAEGTPDWPVTTPTKSIAGQVIDHETGDPVAGATVSLIREIDWRRVQSTTCDGSGNYSIVRDAADPYTYTLVAYHATGDVAGAINGIVPS